MYAHRPPSADSLIEPREPWPREESARKLGRDVYWDHQILFSDRCAGLMLMERTVGLFTFLKRRREARDKERRQRDRAHATPVFPSASLDRRSRAEIDLTDPLNPLSPWSPLNPINQPGAAPEVASPSHGHDRHHDVPSHTPSYDPPPSHTPSHDYGGHHHTPSYDPSPSHTPSYDSGSSYDSGGSYDGGGHHGG